MAVQRLDKQKNFLLLIDNADSLGMFLFGTASKSGKTAADAVGLSQYIPQTSTGSVMWSRIIDSLDQFSLENEVQGRPKDRKSGLLLLNARRQLELVGSIGSKPSPAVSPFRCRHKQAVERLEQVGEIRRGIPDVTHPDRLASQHELAGAYLGLGQHKQAAELLEHVVKTHRALLNATHLDRLASQHALAEAYMGIGQQKKAVELLGQVVKTKEKTLDATPAAHSAAINAYISTMQVHSTDWPPSSKLVTILV